jgi:ERCC4-type nuclease
MEFQNIFEKSSKTKEKPKQKIIIDFREKNSLLPSKLINLGFEIEFQQLSIGDYIVKNTIIERKTTQDFISSMLNKRLIRQIEALKQVPEKLILIEGIEENELYHEQSTVNENAIRGMILSITLKHKVPLIFTKDTEDSAKFISVLMKKSEKGEASLNDKPRPRNTNEQQQYILEGFPGIGPKTARKLLEEFKTLENIFCQPIENIEKIIGKKSNGFKIIKIKYKN